MPDATFAALLRAFADAVAADVKVRVVAWPEDQLKAPISRLIEEAARSLGRTAACRTEAFAAGISGRPDIGIAVDGLLTGYVELKAPGRGARPERFTGTDKVQWEKFRSIPNLIYTDGSEWSLYQTGVLVRRVRLDGRVDRDGATAVAEVDAAELAVLLEAFLSWAPIVPTTAKALAEVLAPLCHLVRQDVLVAMDRPGSALSQLAEEWRTFLFPDADDSQFADAYAQTVTYALLLARFSGSRELGVDAAARALARGHGLLSQTLKVLTDGQARSEIEVGIDLLERSIAAVDIDRLTAGGRDPWLYFYEDFLASYDPKLRKDRGVYYTPAQVVEAQVRLVSELLETRLDKPLAFADPGVVVLDPAAGTGTYPLAAIGEALARVRARYGEGAVAGHATELARNVHSFEILIGPYTVAHLRISQQVLAAGGSLPDDGAHVYLTDTLESPHAQPPAQMTLLHRPLSEEHRRAQHVKAETRVLVCIGNPPYDRQTIDPGDLATLRKGGWVRDGDPGERAILDDFLDPARAAGAGVHLKNLYNDYIYFWRWALWKVFDSTDGAGIVSFITASSYLRGPGFIGMRERMRRTFDDLWIIDLEGDNLGARKTENVFAIQTPVAIAVGVRTGTPRPDVPARVRYTRIEGTREQKLARLAEIEGLADLKWADCQADWHAPFISRTDGDYWSWPLLTDLFPWQQSGVKIGRTWPADPTRDALEARWRHLTLATRLDRPALFKNSPTGKSADWRPRNAGPTFEPILSMPASAAPPPVIRFASRSFDRQYLLDDERLLDRGGPSLHGTASANQVFLTSLLTTVLGGGPSATVSAAIPDLHHFRGSFGGKDVVPLWRDARATVPNVTHGLLGLLATTVGHPVSGEDLLAYVYAVLAGPGYADRFGEELTIPGPRIPLTRDAGLFDRAVALGRRLIWLHTYGERFVPAGERVARVPQGTARAIRPVPSTADRYPESFSYDPATRELAVGDGSFGPVEPEVWGFSVSGFEVVRSWLAYRMKSGAGRKSSPLDDIRPDRWEPEFDRELLELLWVLEATVAEFPALDQLLGEVVAGPCFAASDLPSPTEEERVAPRAGEGEEQEGLGLFEPADG